MTEMKPFLCKAKVHYLRQASWKWNWPQQLSWIQTPLEICFHSRSCKTCFSHMNTSYSIINCIAELLGSASGSPREPKWLSSHQDLTLCPLCRFLLPLPLPDIVFYRQTVHGLWHLQICHDETATIFDRWCTKGEHRKRDPRCLAEVYSLQANLCTQKLSFHKFFFFLKINLTIIIDFAATVIKLAVFSNTAPIEQLKQNNTIAIKSL